MKNLLFPILLLMLVAGCQSGTGGWLPLQIDRSDPIGQANVDVDTFLKSDERSKSTAMEVASPIQQIAYLEELPVESTNVEATSGSAGTLTEIESWALAINPAIRQATAELNALRGKRVQAGLAPNPTFGINGEDINEGGSAGRYGMYFGNKIIRGNKLCLSRNTISAEIEAKQNQLAELQQRLFTDVRTRFFELLIASKQAALTRQLVELSQDAVDATESLVDARELARTSLLQAELELQKSQLNLKRADNEVIAARRNLAALVDEADLPFESVDGSLDQFVDLVDIEQAYDRLLLESPEISRLHANVEQSKRKLAEQCAKQIVDVSWQAGVAYDTATNDVVTNFQVGFPVLRNDRNQGAIRQARQQIIASEKQVEKRALQMRERLVEAYRLYVDAKLQVEAMTTEILPKAEETLRLISLGYREGEVGFLDLLTAQRTYFQLNLNYIQQQRKFWRQRILIEGFLLSNNLQN